MKIVDLSHVMNVHTPGWVGYAGNKMYYAQNLQTVRIVAQRIDTALHVGTHFDGAMHATEREIAALAPNVLMVATYWMSWQRISGRLGIRDDDEGAPDERLMQAAYQVMALIAPFLQGDARVLIEHLGAHYLRMSD